VVAVGWTGTAVAVGACGAVAGRAPVVARDGAGKGVGAAGTVDAAAAEALEAAAGASTTVVVVTTVVLDEAAPVVVPAVGVAPKLASADLVSRYPAR